MKFALLNTFATDGAFLLVRMLAGPLVARLLLPEGRGALAAVMFWPQLLDGIGFLSLNEAVTYCVGDQPERASVITASSFWLAIVLAGLITSAGYMLMPFLLGEVRAHLVYLARIYLLVFIPFNFMTLSLLASDHGELHFSRYNTLRLLIPVIYLAGLTALWALGHVSMAWIVGANCAGTVLVGLLRVVLAKNILLTRPSLKAAMMLLGFARRFHAATILLFLASQADQFVVLTIWGDAVLGQYAVAMTVAAPGLAVVSSMFQKVLFPYLAHLRDPAEQVGLLARGVRHATVLLVGLSLPLALLMPRLVSSLFGSAFQDAVGPAWVLLGAYLFNALKIITIQSLRGLGESHPGYMGATVSLGLFLLLVWPLGNALGLVGVASASGLANVGALGYLANYLRRRFKLSLRDLWGLTPRTMGEIWSITFRMNPFVAKTAS